METKLAKLKACWYAGDFAGALAIAAKFPNLGDDRKAIQQGNAAYKYGEFYASMGYDVQALKDDGIVALKERYKLS